MGQSEIRFAAAVVEGSFSTLISPSYLNFSTPRVSTMDISSSEIQSLLKERFGVNDPSKPSWAAVFSGYLSVAEDGSYSIGVKGTDGARVSLDERMQVCDGAILKRNYGVDLCPSWLQEDQSPAWLWTQLSKGLHRIDVEYFRISSDGAAKLDLWFEKSDTVADHQTLVSKVEGNPNSVPIYSVNEMMYAAQGCSPFYSDQGGQCATKVCAPTCSPRSGTCTDMAPEWWGIATDHPPKPGVCACSEGFAGETCSECGHFRFGSECHSLLLIIIPTSAGVIVLGLVVLMFRYRKALTEKVKRQAAKLKMIALPNLPSGISSAQFIDKKQIEFGQKFASGGAGQVFRAKFSGYPVCVKELFSSIFDETDLQEFVQEASMLSQLNHPNIVRFYGICIEDKHVYLVTELCSSSLANLIEGGRMENSTKLRIALQISQGMAYIHSKGIYHRDLKADNVLLLNKSTGSTHVGDSSADYTVKICDFGLATFHRVTVRRDKRMSFKNADTSDSFRGHVNPMSRSDNIKETNPLENPNIQGTPGFIPPEVIMGTSVPKHAKKIDVFAYGIVLWTIFEGTNNAWPTKDLPEDMLRAVVSGERPVTTPLTPSPVADLMRQCWAHDPEQRPNFSAISKRVSSLNIPDTGTRLSAIKF